MRSAWALWSKPPMLAHAVVERILAGMAEGRVAEVVRQRQRLGQILVEPQRAGQRAGDLRHLDRVGQARAEMVALVVDEDLRLVLQPAERGRVDDAVAVALELAAGRRAGLAAPAGRGCATGRRRRARASGRNACGNRVSANTPVSPQWLTVDRLRLPD